MHYMYMRDIAYIRIGVRKKGYFALITIESNLGFLTNADSNADVYFLDSHHRMRIRMSITRLFKNEKEFTRDCVNIFFFQENVHDRIIKK